MRSFRKVPLLAVLPLAALLMVGVAAASAHGGLGHGLGARGIAISPLVT